MNVTETRASKVRVTTRRGRSPAHARRDFLDVTVRQELTTVSQIPVKVEVPVLAIWMALPASVHMINGASSALK